MAAKKKADGKSGNKKKTPSTKAGAKKPTTSASTEETESLSEFQDTRVTGRTDGLVKIDPVTTKKVTITKVKITKKNEVIISSSRLESDSSTTELPNETHKGRTAHPDLKNAFQSMNVHLGLLCGYLSTQQIKDIDKYNSEHVEKFTVSAISISEKDGSDGYVITGRRETKPGKFVILNTPFTLVDEDEKTRYKYMSDLEQKINLVLAETEKYQSGEKVGESQQVSLPFGDAEEEDENEEDDIDVEEGEDNDMSDSAVVDEKGDLKTIE